MAFKLGLDCILYRQTTGTRAAWPGTGAAPNLDIVTNCRNVEVNLSKTEADVTTRGGNGWKQNVAALKEGEVSFEMVYDTGDADFTAFQASFMNNTTIACAILDGVAATSGTQGLWADFMVTTFAITQNLEEAVMVKVSLKPTYSGVAPAWITTGS